jgi:hypothetical protein
MANQHFYNPYTVREQRATILFWIVIVVFVATAILAILAVASSIGMIRLQDPPDMDLYSKIVWALWIGILLEVVALFVLLSKDLLGLSAEPKILELRNTMGEVIDGLEAEGEISPEKADMLRTVLGPRAAVVKPVLSGSG